MCASSREEGDNLSVTDVKLELLMYLGGAQLDVRTSCEIHVDGLK